MGSPEETETQIVEAVAVSQSQVLIAKTYLVNWSQNAKWPTDIMLNEVLTDFLAIHSATQPSQVVLNSSVPPEPQLSQVIHSCSWQLAFAEAVWGLVNAGVLLWHRGSTLEVPRNQPWTTVLPGTGGSSSVWVFHALHIVCPRHVVLAPSRAHAKQEILANGDLYLQFLSISNLHPSVEDYLRQAIECFRHELYLPAVAMMGSALELAWIALGKSLQTYVDANGGGTAISNTNRSVLNDRLQGIGKKIPLIVGTYDQHQSTHFAPLIKASRVRVPELKSASTWAENVREARNALHPGDEDRLDATYETVSMLLLTTSLNLGMIYRIIDTVDKS